MYIRHTLIASARFLWSRPQTTSHVVLVRPGGDRRSCACESGNGAGSIPYGTGPIRRRSTCEKDRARAEMGHKQSKRDHARERRRKQRDIVSEDSKASGVARTSPLLGQSMGRAWAEHGQSMGTLRLYGS